MGTANHSDAAPQRIDLSTLTPGFTDGVHDSQGVFRALLEALSRPGTIVSIDAVLRDLRTQGTVPLAVLASLLALADYSTPVFLQHDDHSLSDAVRFHTGAPLTTDSKQAVFAYLHDAASMPSLDAFSLGDAETPENAATLFIRVESLENGPPLLWSGPGMPCPRAVCVAGLPDAFWRERAGLASKFPCGIDCYFVAGGALIGLPRTTQVGVD